MPAGAAAGWRIRYQRPPVAVTLTVTRRCRDKKEANRVCTRLPRDPCPSTVEEYGHKPEPETSASSPGCRRPGGVRRGNPARDRPSPRQHPAADRPSARAGDVTDGPTTTHPSRIRTSGTCPATATAAASLRHGPAYDDRDGQPQRTARTGGGQRRQGG